MAQRVKRSRDGMSLTAYPGDGTALLAFDLEEDLTDRLAGFAARYTTPSGDSAAIPNRLSFDRPVTAGTTPRQRRWTPSDVAPIQRFHWAHYPFALEPGDYTYRATAMLFRADDGSRLEPGPSVEVPLDLAADAHAGLRVGFTRGYVSSQGYAERFRNAALRPPGGDLLFDTAPFEPQYGWLGSHGRRLLMGFLEEAIADAGVEVDAFAYDLDEPDVVRALQRLGPRLRIYLDDSARHLEPDSRERAARELLVASAGAANVRAGHFRRFSHDKVLIQKRAGDPIKVLTGSANFSVRGLYAQSNSILVLDDSVAAGLYEQAFRQAWEDPRAFRRSPISSTWFPVDRPGLPPLEVSFAPHSDAALSLERVAQAIAAARSSVLFAVMEMGGTGPVLQALRALPDGEAVFSYGMTQRTDGSVSVKPADRRRGLLVPFAFLSDKVPPPFTREWSGGAGQVIHHKFVVCDFNGADPVVFMGSSNLAAGGETANGDNLLQVRDPALATTYAVEALRLVDHYRFRAAMRAATDVEPLRLKTRPERWWARYYSAGIKRSERLLFAD